MLEQLQNKEIVLFGAGMRAHEFYEMYKDKLNFAFCVTNTSTEWGEKRFCGELDIRQYQAQELKGRYYVVLGVFIAFDNIASQLECDGYAMFEDFIDYRVAEAVLEDKKLALFYGTCILRDVYYSLGSVPAFTDQYVSIFVQGNIKEKDTIAEIRRLYYAKDICDIYVYANKLLHPSEAYNMQRKNLPADCKMIGVSKATFPGYWPQLHNMGYNANWLFEVAAPFDNKFWHLMYSREDANITRLVEEGKSPEEICRILSADDYYSEKELKKHLRICFKTLKMAEKGLEVKVGDFIKSQYQAKMLWQDFTHPKKALLWEYVKQVLGHLEICEEALDEIIKEAPEYIHRSSDMPIYPSVAKYLGLSWIDENTRYEVMTCKGIRLMTFKEYVIHYASYIQAVLKIRKGW